jgi:hypothetical protein
MQLPIILTGLALGSWSGGITGFIGSILMAYRLSPSLIQLPYVYITDVYFMPIPSQVVLTVILPKLLLEDVVSVLISHIILYRIELSKIF